MNFLSFLSHRGVITPESKSAVEQYAQNEGVSIDDVLIKNGITEDTLLKLKSEYFNIPFRVVGGEKIPAEILKYVPEESATHYRFVPIGVADGVLEVGVVDPDNTESMDAIQFISTKIGMPFKVFLVSVSDFKEILQSYRGLSDEIDKALKELESSTGGPIKKTAEEEYAAAVTPTRGKEVPKETLVEDAPVTKMVAVILSHAIEGNASDIHIENMGDKVRIRFRIDGVLHTSLLLPSAVHAAVVSRIKILTSLKLDERRKPQDGRFSARIEGRKVDFRVSTLPSYYGEKVVMRILDSEKGVLTLSSLGMKDKDLATVRAAIERPYGMILLTGPTGSGKSTTLYAMLNELDRDSDNVISLEDPVEYSMPGVSQSQVQPEIGYTFASGLRSILRQDPDVIMVGEIRDKETAQLAVQAALTGHLVFSTLHTNTAVGVVSRLIDMGVDPYLIAPTLILSIGQRLVRKFCPQGKKEIELTDPMKLIINKELQSLPESFRKDIQIPDRVYEAQPSPDCPTGVRGRLAVFELLEIDADIQEIILKTPMDVHIQRAARAKGMYSMKEDALLKAFDGKIPYVEVNTL